MNLPKNNNYILKCITISYDNNNKNILFVNDDKDIVYTLDIYLKSNGYTTVSFVNLVEALYYTILLRILLTIVVITDYEIPQMSGLDLIKTTKKQIETTA